MRETLKKIFKIMSKYFYIAADLAKEEINIQKEKGKNVITFYDFDDTIVKKDDAKFKRLNLEGKFKEAYDLFPELSNGVMDLFALCKDSGIEVNIATSSAKDLTLGEYGIDNFITSILRTKTEDRDETIVDDEGNKTVVTKTVTIGKGVIIREYLQERDIDLSNLVVIFIDDINDNCKEVERSMNDLGVENYTYVSVTTNDTYTQFEEFIESTDKFSWKEYINSVTATIRTIEDKGTILYHYNNFIRILNDRGICYEFSKEDYGMFLQKLVDNFHQKDNNQTRLDCVQKALEYEGTKEEWTLEYTTDILYSINSQ